MQGMGTKVEHIKDVVKKMGSPSEILDKMATIQNIQQVSMESSLHEVTANPCSLCGGAGYIHPLKEGKVDYSVTTTCQCTKERLEEEAKAFLIKSCCLPPFAVNMDFDNFKPYSAVMDAYNKARDMADNPNKLAWLALIGGNGNGKTHLAVSVCKAWIQAGIPSRYVMTSLLMDELRDSLRAEDSDYSYTKRFQYYCKVPLLLLDDLGIESPSRWVQEKLETLIDYRLMNNLSLIITSNSSIDEMSNRIKSRIIRHPAGSVVVMMAGDYGKRNRNTPEA